MVRPSRLLSLLILTTIVAACSGSPGKAPTSGPCEGFNQIPPIPEGSYSARVTRQDMLDAGVDEFQVGALAFGEHTLTFKDGKYRNHLESREPVVFPDFAGDYKGDETTLILVDHPAQFKGQCSRFTWRMEGTALVLEFIALSEINPDPQRLAMMRGLYESHPWKRTGD